MGSDALARPTYTGDHYARGDQGYEPGRRAAVWNARKPDRYPDEILVAADAHDVVIGVRSAKQRGQRVGIRSGGHSVVGTGVRNGGLLIDLSRLTDIEVDPASHTAWIGSGVTGGQLGRRLMPDGLAFPYGGSPTVGLGGFILSGGYGLNGKTFGSAAGNVVEVDVVTADGELIHADDHTNSDYLWAARGAGYGFFGVVVRFRIRLYDAARHLTKAAYSFAAEDFSEMAAWFFANLDTFDDKLMTLVFGQRLPNTTRNVANIVTLGFADDEAEAQRLFQPLEDSPVMRLARRRETPSPVSVEQVWLGTDLLYPEGKRYFADTTWINEPTDPGFIAAVQKALDTLPTQGSHLMMNPWNPEDRADAVLSGTSRLPFHLYGVGEEAAQDGAIQAWINARMTDIAPFSTGIGKVNESDLLIRDQHVLEPRHAARLEELRGVHDPDGRFHSFLRHEAARDER